MQLDIRLRRSKNAVVHEMPGANLASGSVDQMLDRRQSHSIDMLFNMLNR